MTPVKIYALIDPRNNQVYYVGKTIKTMYSRMSGHRYCARHDNTPRDQRIREILTFVNILPYRVLEVSNEHNWEEREKFWIVYFRKIYPDLCNIADGGGGILGKKWEQELCKAMSDIKSKCVLQLTLKFGLIKEYPSCKTAGKETGAPSSHISECARSKGTTSCKGYIWIYKHDYEEWKNSNIKQEYKKDIHHLFKEVMQYNLNGQLLKKWASIKEAGETLKINPRSITRCKTGWRKTYKNFIWK